MIERFSVWRVNLSPCEGSEQSGSRPVLVISPNEMNDKLPTVIVTPMTTRLRAWPSRAGIKHKGKSGEVALDQIRTIDKGRLGQDMGPLDPSYHDLVLSTLADIFGK